MDSGFTRRELLKTLAALGVVWAGSDLVSGGVIPKLANNVEAAAAGSTVAVASGGGVFSMVSRAINRLGGMSRFVKKGAKVAIKPNIAWARTPEQAANTNPMVVEALIKLCKDAGAGSIAIYENPCDNYRVTFEKSGIMEVCKRQGVPIVSGAKEHIYQSVSVPRGKTMKSMKVISALLSADCYINAPIAKVHSAATLSLALKNQMGCVLDRGFFHTKGLHQCIADCATVLRPHLSILDSTRMLMTNGPSGPGEVKRTGKIAASADMVALDSYGAKLFGYKPKDIGYIVKANQLGLGEMDFSKIKILNA